MLEHRPFFANLFLTGLFLAGLFLARRFPARPFLVSYHLVRVRLIGRPVKYQDRHDDCHNDKRRYGDAEKVPCRRPRRGQELPTLRPKNQQRKKKQYVNRKKGYPRVNLNPPEATAGFGSDDYLLQRYQ